MCWVLREWVKMNGHILSWLGGTQAQPWRADRLARLEAKPSQWEQMAPRQQMLTQFAFSIWFSV